MINTSRIFSQAKIMPVKAISFRSINKPNEIQGDTFERTQNSKRDYIVEKTADSEIFGKFLNYIENSDFISRVEEIADSPENYLGSGFEGTTYAIPGNDDWIIKTYKRSFIVPLPMEKTTILETKDITPGINIGQNIANIRIPCNKTNSRIYHILRKQKGRTFGIPYDISDYVTEGTVKKYNLSLAKLASSPDKTFDKLITDVKTVTDYGYEFDYNNPDNFFYDDRNREINFVDIHDKSEKETEQYEQVLFGITSGNFLKNYLRNEKLRGKLSKTYQLLDRVSEKYTKSMKKQGAKFSDNEVTDTLIETGILCRSIKGEKEEKKEYLRKNNLLNKRPFRLETEKDKS